MIILEELFCPIDDFCRKFEPGWPKYLITCGSASRLRSGNLSLSEVMTILIAFETSGSRNFKSYYLSLVCHFWHQEFPELVSYPRFVQLIPRAIVPMIHYLSSLRGSSTGMGFIDSTSLKVGHNRRIFSHRVFEGIAQRGKTSVDWFYGFKVHLVINARGELLNFALTPGNVDERKPVRELFKGLQGKFIADKGYISKDLASDLRSQGIILLTKFKSNMKNQLVEWSDRLLMKKRALIESVIDQLKNICHIEHTRHRSPTNFVAHLIAGLIA